MYRRLLNLAGLLGVTFTTQAQSPISCHNDVAARVTTNQPLAGERIVRYALTPSVVPINSTQVVLIEVTTTGQPSELRLVNETVQTTLLLNDAGTDGDKKAKDGVFSANLPPPGGKWSESFFGYIRLFVGGTQVLQYNGFMSLLTPDMVAATTKKIDNTAQYSDYVFNVVVPSTASNPTEAERQAYTKTFYKYHADDFDFINYVLAPGFLDNRFHGTIRNNVLGIGFSAVSPANVSAPFGSAGRLVGYNQFPIPDVFDGAHRGYNHEIAHQWINQSTKTFLKDGVPHWPLSNLATSVMGASQQPTKQGVEFPYTFTDVGTGWQLAFNPKTSENGFNDWELYMMGLLPAAEVTTPALIFKDQTTTPTATTYPKTAFNAYTLNDFIAIEGQRVPNAAQSQKRFAIATIVLSESLLTPNEMAYFDYMAKRAEGRAPVLAREGFASYMGKPFQVATGGRGTLRALLNTNANCASVPARPTITHQGGNTFCQGRSVVLSAPSSDGYVWYLDGVPLPDRTASLTATQAGAYALSVRNAAGCNSLLSAEVTLSTTAAPAAPTITAVGSASACAGTPVALRAEGSSTYLWQLNGVAIGGATTSTYSATASGNYTASAQNASGCVSPASTPIAVTLIPFPNKPTITPTANGLTSSSPTGNQWLLNGIAIPGATAQTFGGTSAGGPYTVRVTANGCSSVSDALVITATDPTPGPLRLRHQPNPASETALLSFDLPVATPVTLRLLSSAGTFVRLLTEGHYPAGVHTLTVDTSQLPAGTYLYRLEAGQASQTNKLLIVR